eukprot:m.22499 g.22499  ORF g.22499 m.22499 type:complete len:1519 (+) comp28345_c0_seq2:433-4989(+)
MFHHAKPCHFFIIASLISFQVFALLLPIANNSYNATPLVSVSSSSVLEDEGIKFIPQLAIDRVESRLWSNCFVSERETYPWWRLDLGKQETITDIYIQTRLDDAHHQPSVKVEEMNGLSVYVDNIRDTGGKSHYQQCGSAWTYTKDRFRIKFPCGSLKGRYIHVIVMSSQPKHLAICEIFANHVWLRNLQHASLQGQTYSVHPAEDPAKPFRFAFDDKRKTCASTNTSSTSQFWILRFAQPIFLNRCQLCIKLKSTATYSVLAESHMGDDKTFYSSHWRKTAKKNDTNACFAFNLGLFVQYIKIVMNSPTPLKLEVCEVNMYRYGSVLDIYHSFPVTTALNQLSPFSYMSKAIDGSLQTAPEACYRSAQQANSWWRMELPDAIDIDYVVITLLPERSALSQMDGFSVYVGNETSYSGEDNVQCGSPWRAPSEIVLNITVVCADRPVAKYVYIVASGRSTEPIPSLSLCEVQVCSCNGSDPVIDMASKDIQISSAQETTAFCTASGCPTPRISWSGPNGQMLNSMSDFQRGSHVASTLRIPGSSGGGSYTCTAYGEGTTNATRQITVAVFPFPRIVTPLMDVTARYGEAAVLTCAATGYPVPTITWTSPTNRTFELKSNFSLSGLATSSISVFTKGPNGGGTFTCTANNGKGIDTAQAEASVKSAVTILGPKIHEVIDGGEIKEVMCVGEGYPKPVVVWKQSNGGVPSQSDEYKISNAEYAVGRNLTLGRAIYRKGGLINYTCQATNKKSQEFASVSIRVKVDVNFITQPHHVYGKVGDNLSLSCEAEGISVETLQWHKNGRQITASSKISISTVSARRSLRSNLIVHNAELQDGSDDYYCTSGPFSDPKGRMSSKATIGILESVRILWNRNQTLQVGSDSRPFKCLIRANPQPSGELVLDGNTVTNVNRPVDSKTASWFISYPISPVTAQKGGDYTCIARMGPSLAINHTEHIGILVSFVEKPQPVTLKDGENQTSTDNVNNNRWLTCKVQGYPLPAISWTLTVGEQIKNVSATVEEVDFSLRTRTSKIHFGEVHHDLAGTYECLASNSYNEQRASADVKIDCAWSLWSLCGEKQCGTAEPVRFRSKTLKAVNGGRECVGTFSESCSTVLPPCKPLQHQNAVSVLERQEISISCMANQSADQSLPLRVHWYKIDHQGKRKQLLPRQDVGRITQTQIEEGVFYSNLVYYTASKVRTGLYKCRAMGARGASQLSDGIIVNVTQSLDCGTPAFSRGDVVILTRNYTRYSGKATFRCHAGYQLVGSLISTCLSTGRWSKIPVCLPMKCGRPNLLGNVIVNSSDFFYPTVIGFQCPPGYSVEGPRRAQCQVNQRWSRPSPKCLKNDFPCGYPPHLSHSTLTTNWKTAEYTCNDEMEPVKQTIICLENGQWSNPLTQCTISNCSIPEAIPYGAVSFNSRTRGGTAQYGCGVCYTLSGRRRRRCQVADDQRNLRWSERKPECLIIRCGNPPELENGSATNKHDSTCGAVATYKCNSRFLLLGNTHVVCTPDGNWSKPPRCIALHR